MSEDLLKAVPVFEGGLSKWPTFYLKFKTLLESKELEHIILRPSDPPVVGESTEDKAKREKLAATRKKDDAKVRALLLNKI